jgi:branched-chain amino acid transport system ATP-binding protein
MEQVLDIFPDLKPLMSRRASKLSGGERNMLAVARALMSNPVVLLLDEATGGLAPKIARQLWNHVAALSERGVAVVAVEQNVSLALEFSDSVYVLASGRTLFSGSPTELRARGDLEQMFLGAQPGEPAVIDGHT